MLGSMNENLVLTEDRFYDLLGFLVTSAQLTLTDPDEYPVLRLVDASHRLMKAVVQSGQIIDEGLLTELQAKLDECIKLVGTDEDKLKTELDSAVLLMTRAMIRRSKG
jgi:hypothetical protein